MARCPRVAALLIALLAAVSAASPCRAQDEPPPLAVEPNREPPSEALEYYRRGQQYYDEGRYRESVEELERARALDPAAPLLLYNIALVYERLGEFQTAVEYLERYLRFELPDEDRERAERMISRLRGARQHVQPRVITRRQTRVVERRFGRADGWFWGMVGTTLALGAGAIATGSLAMVWGDFADGYVLGDDGDLEYYDSVASTAETLAYTTDALIGAASAAAITALLLYVLRHTEVRAEEPAGGEREGLDAPAATEGEEQDDAEEDGEDVPAFRWEEQSRSVHPPRTVALAASAAMMALGW